MKKLLHGLARPSTFLPLILFCIAAGITAAQFVPENVLAVIVNGVVITLWIMMLLAYGPALLRSLRASVMTRGQHLETGILLLWTGAGALSLWAEVFILMGEPLWMVGHWVPSVCRMAVCLSGFYFLRVPDGMPQTGVSYATVAVVVAALLVSAVLLSRYFV